MTSASDGVASERKPHRLTRRALLVGTGVAAGALGATSIGAVLAPSLQPEQDSNLASSVGPVAAAGIQQAGVSRPAIPQQHCIVAVAELDRASLELSLLALGEQILGATDASNSNIAFFPDGPQDLTVTIGIGQGALAATNHPELAELVSLPAFSGDAALPESRRAGDIFLSVNSSDPALLEPALSTLTSSVHGYRERWSDFGFRAASTDDISRNPFGYHDGVIVPRGKDELFENVWIGEGPLSGGTICVMRRFALDTATFRGLPASERDAVIGREQQTGAPLSGGVRGDAVNLLTKSDEGEFLIPTRSHARAAHPSFTGSDLMLRRSYSYRASDTDHGLLFISFQKDVETFSRTQLRLDEIDSLMDFTTPTATGAFVILPGFSAETPLGSSLFR